MLLLLLFFSLIKLKEFKIKSNGLNSILEILSLACVACQRDALMLDEYKNPLIEFARSFLFSQQQSLGVDSIVATADSSIYINFLQFWLSILIELQARGGTLVYECYLCALDTVKRIYMSSIEWKRNVAHSIIAFISMPWLCSENAGLDLDMFKDKTIKQCSGWIAAAAAGAQSINSSSAVSIMKIRCIQMICMLPKNVCPQWRTQMLTRCVRDESDEELRMCSIKYMPYLIYFLGVSANSIVSQLVQPAMRDERSPHIFKAYASLMGIICCVLSRKSIVIRRRNYECGQASLNDAGDVGDDGSDDDHVDENNDDTGDEWSELADHFEMLCTCCDRLKIEKRLLPACTRAKNIDLLNLFYNRPKHVDTHMLMQFVQSLCRHHGSTADSTSVNERLVAEVHSTALKSFERALNHVEFGKQLDKQALASHDLLGEVGQLHQQHPQALTTNTNSNLTYIYKEALTLFSDDTLDSLARFDFCRFGIPRLASHSHGAQRGLPSSTSLTNLNSSSGSGGDDSTASALLISINTLSDAVNSGMVSSSTASLSETQLDHNFNLELQLCELYVRAKSSKNLMELYMYIVALGAYALNLRQRSVCCDEYMFVCVKHLLEIFDSNEANRWSKLASSLAQRQLFTLSKRVNMQELLAEFEERVCDLAAESIYNSIRQNLQHGYLQKTNYALKDLLRVFNVHDSSKFVINYQRYIVPLLLARASTPASGDLITKSLVFLSKKIGAHMRPTQLIEDNFPYIFTYTTLNSNDIGHVFHYITDEARLDIDKLVNYNKQRLFNELLSKCGEKAYRVKVWQAVCMLSAQSADEAQALAGMAPPDEARIVKSIESGLLAALIHFDMCLMRSSINQKEKCHVLESLNVLIGLLGPTVITGVRYKIMTTLKLAMQQCSRFSELICKLWDTFLRNVDKSALGAILNQVSVNLLQLIDAQPYKIGKIFEYLIVQNKEHLEGYFNELYFIPEHSCLQQVNQVLRKHVDVKCIMEQSILFGAVSSSSSTTGSSSTSGGTSSSDVSGLKALVYLIKHYLKGAHHENADLRVKALERLYALFKEKSSQILHLIQRQENTQIVSDIVLALLNGCRDTDMRAKHLVAACMGEIGAIDPAYVMITNGSNTSTVASGKRISSNALVPSASAIGTAASATSTTHSNSSAINSLVSSSSLLNASNELLIGTNCVGDESAEFSENFAYLLIIELSKAYLAARNTHEQDSASYAIQECLKLYGCSGPIGGAGRWFFCF
jgi:hypothetical protein